MRLASVLSVVLLPTLAAAAPKGPLPLTRVRLYETGVGYFERSGMLLPGASALPVPAGHLDDALKTLVVLGGEVQVGAVAFSSSVSRDMARKLAGLPESGDAPLGFSELSRSFKGALVTLATTSGSFSGRLVEVLEPGQGELERCSEADKDAAACRLIERGSLVVFTTSGELRRVPSAEVRGLRPLEPAARERLDAALDALSQRGAQSRRDLGLLTPNGGKVSLGYVAEAPVWRSTYRIVLGTEQARLQGWALLHNDTDENWHDVQVDLVNGRPSSFLYPLAAPRYARRELVTPPEQLPSVPQLFDVTVDDLWSGLGLSGIGEGGGGRGEGIGLGGVGTVGYGYGSGMGRLGEGRSETESAELDIGNLATLTPAEGVEAAALFRYTLPSKLALAAHASALVPFVDVGLKVRQFSWFGVGRGAAASALHVVNDTKQTLPEGTLSVFGDGGFAGESLLPRTKPGEQRLLTYGVDLDVELVRASSQTSEEPRRFALSHDDLLLHYVRRRSEELVLENRSQSTRTVYVELDVLDNAKLEGAVELGRDRQSQKTYVVLQVPAGQTKSETLRLEEGLQRRYPAAQLDSRLLWALAQTSSIEPEQRASLRRAAERLLSAEKRRGAVPKRQAELEQALVDVARVRENARILGAVHAKQAEAMAGRIVELETRVSGLRSRIAELGSEADGFVVAAKRELQKL